VLHPDDRALVDRDRQIPALGLCLDGARLAERVAAAAEPAWGPLCSVRVDYLRYKPGTSCVAGLVVGTASGERHAFAKAGAPGQVAKLGKTAVYATPDRHGFAPVLDPDLALLIAPASADRRLPGLPRLLADPAGLLDDDGSRSPGLAPGVRVLRYKPERRLVAELAGPDGPLAVAKVQAPRLVAGIAAAARALGGAGLPVPRVVGRSRRHGIVLSEFLHGRPVTDGTTDEDLLAAAGGLLAQWHRVRPWRGAATAPEVPDPAELVGAVEVLLPGLAAPAERAFRAAAARLPAGAEPVVVHGDFSADQLLRAGGAVCVLDLDRARLDRPEVDAASWFAAEVAEGRCDPQADPGDVLGPLLRAYAAGSAGGRDLAPALPQWCALALLARAVEPFRLRRPGWAGRTEVLVRAAGRLAGGPG
jgi:hypothetical protein